MLRSAAFADNTSLLPDAQRTPEINCNAVQQYRCAGAAQR
jgi:hypothetical protein